MNTTKLFDHPSITGGYILETSGGNYSVSVNGIQPTTANGTGAPVYWDIVVQSTFAQALQNTEKYMSADFIKGLLVAVQDKIEDGDEE
jgi:hypothetical protein